VWLIFFLPRFVGVETKEWSMFLGVALDRYERSVAENGASLAMLEGVGPIEDGGQL
jgi:hypothetical protein